MSPRRRSADGRGEGRARPGPPATVAAATDRGTPPPADPPLRIGVSACLLGQEVRYDGGHRRDRWLGVLLGPFAAFVPVCPEVEIGLGVPRPTIRLEVGADDAVRLVEPAGRRDLTETMDRYARDRVRALAALDLDGYVLKSNSPSCGMERVKTWRENGRPGRRNGRGLFARALLDALPLLPVEEEGRLQDAALRENFVVRLFAWRRARTFFRGRWTAGGLVAFHSREKLLLMAHHPAAYRALGRLVASVRRRPREETRDAYLAEFAAGLRHVATPRRHLNVLHHMVGYFRDRLEDADRAELLEAVERFAAGTVPLVVPLTLLRHHARRLRIEWLAGQTYLEPHPRELLLRNRP